MTKRNSNPRKPGRRTYLVLTAVLAATILVKLNHWTDVDDRLYAWWKDSATSLTEKQRSIWLNRYTLAETKSFDSVADNLSGITYNPISNTFWMIINSPQRLLEVDEQLTLLRTVQLENFSDTEAVAYVGDGQFLIVDERDQTIAIAEISQSTVTLDKSTLRKITLKTNGSGNKGFEGIAADPSNDLVYVVRERDPMRLLRIKGFLGNSQDLLIENVDLIKTKNLYLDDLSGLHWDKQTGNLLILSHESNALAEIATDGSKVSYMDLVSGFHGLPKDIPQAEGVTLGPNRDLYIVSEPNLIYRFTPEAL